MKETTVILLWVFLCLAMGPSAGAAVKIHLDPAASSAEFFAIGRPSALKIHGSKGKPAGDLKIEGANVSGEIQLNLNDFETGIGMRDRHMKEKYLEIEKEDFKFAKLTLQKISLPPEYWQAPKPQAATFTGRLKLHGVERDINGALEITHASPQSLSGTAKFDLTLSDYKIAIPTFSGITMAEKVDVEIHFTSRVERQ